MAVFDLVGVLVTRFIQTYQPLDILHSRYAFNYAAMICHFKIREKPFLPFDSFVLINPEFMFKLVNQLSEIHTGLYSVPILPAFVSKYFGMQTCKTK